MDFTSTWKQTRCLIFGKKKIEMRKRTRKKYQLLDMIDAKVLDVGTFQELSENNGIDINRIKWSYYEGFLLNKRYLVVKEEK